MLLFLELHSGGTMRRGMLAQAVTVGLLTVTLPGMAQEHGRPVPKDHHEMHPGGDPAAHLEHLREALDLTDAQVVQVQAIVADVMERHAAIHEGGHDDASHEQMRALHDETMARLSEVLTEEQQEKLEAMHREMMERHEDGHGAHLLDRAKAGDHLARSSRGTKRRGERYCRMSRRPPARCTPIWQPRMLIS